jgi:spore maturation protein CgeB
MKFRLLISGSKKNANTTDTFIIRNFDDSFEYEVLDFPDKFNTLLESKINRLVYRICPILIVRYMDLTFLKQVSKFKPTIILIFKGMEISKWSLSKIKAQGIKLVNYNFDHPFHFFARGTGNRFVREAIPYFDLHISYSSIIASELSKKYNVKTAVIPFGFHITPEQFNLCLEANRPEINRACFVGNPDKLRISAISKLVSSGVPIDLYGFGWQNFFSENDFISIHLPRQKQSFWSNPLEFWLVLRQYRIQLNFFRPHNEGSHNLRTFEVPAVGGILLTPVSDEQSYFFTQGKEIFFYSDQENLQTQCKTLLGMDVPSIKQIRMNARAKSVEMDYSYLNRTKHVIDLLNEVSLSANL